MIPVTLTPTQIPYYDLLIEFPFKGDETPLRNMEHAELISIGTYNGAQRVSFVIFKARILTFGLQAVHRPYVLANLSINMCSNS
jgi:hypothetical protein